MAEMGRLRVPAAVPAAMSSCAVNSEPAAMAFRLTPKMMKVQVFPLRLALTLLPAVLRMAPAVTAPVLRHAGKVRLNCRLATDSVPGSNLTGRLTVVPAAPEA